MRGGVPISGQANGAEPVAVAQISPGAGRSDECPADPTFVVAHDVWAPVRRALAHYVTAVSARQAWVMRPMVIPKAGEHSVGVDRRFFAALGQVRNAQQAIGIWAASDELRTPVNWRLHLPEAWLDDKERCSKAAIPEGTCAQTLADGAIDAYLELVERWGLPSRPLVFDAREMDTATVVSRLRAARVPFLARVSGTMRLAVDDLALTGHGTDVLPAQHIMRAARHPATTGGVARRRPGGDPAHLPGGLGTNSGSGPGQGIFAIRATATVPHDDRPSAIGLFNLCYLLGAAFGPAIVALLLAG
jgi:hypothetical protein